MLLTGACRSSRNDGQSYLSSQDNEIPETVLEKLPGLAKAGKFDEAMNLLRPYAEKGNSEAQFNMAIGLIMKDDKTNNNEIVHWVRLSASQGYPQALGLLANAYQFGDYGLSTNIVLAAMWSSAETNADVIPKCLDYERDKTRLSH